MSDSLPWLSQPQRRAGARDGVARRLDRWLPLAGTAEARRLTTIAWCCAGAFLLVDVVWLLVSPLRFERGNWKMLAGLLVVTTLVAVLVPHRVRTSDRRVNVVFRGIVRRCALLWRSALLLLLIVSTFLVFTYLATAAAMPLKDDLLAGIDRALGFDWLTFLKSTNDKPQLAAALTACYRSTGMLLIAIVVWLAFAEREVRLAELLAVLSLTFAGLAIGMIAVPTASAFAHFAPPPELFANFAAANGMWPFYTTFAALRDGSLTAIAFSSADGIVGFPSFHASLGVVTAWALRDFRWLLWPVAALNAVMMVAVLPVGGHHLTELIAGTLTAITAIAVTRLCRKDSAANR